VESSSDVVEQSDDEMAAAARANLSKRQLTISAASLLAGRLVEPTVGGETSPVNDCRRILLKNTMIDDYCASTDAKTDATTPLTS
jgi:hypothetical protein